MLKVRSSGMKTGNNSERLFDKEFFVKQNGAKVYDGYTKNTVSVSVRVTSR